MQPLEVPQYVSDVLQKPKARWIGISTMAGSICFGILSIFLSYDLPMTSESLKKSEKSGSMLFFSIGMTLLIALSFIGAALGWFLLKYSMSDSTSTRAGGFDEPLLAADSKSNGTSTSINDPGPDSGEGVSMNT